ncbi:TIGR01906 family membrane protein [Ohessyouella blattaphilus]|uniref:TIGR01906 family membrane protein n=1 Tax=Ohessyouella blattaphilus TaxID=2949333 RepID=A0ABT1EHC0_9FIRM|nr:TIGR01906 family membrane protein [Ohessyouella blattaphilus]MCP1110095.1 TIGR01906 family membrane protein [Ohessyouella blattaphilus]MCR8563489.1 TIGR01906 family membrane protein [Ohessyouella blattaphilus]
MKKIENVVAFLAMVLLIFTILISSFQLAIYGDSEYKFYRTEYEKYDVTSSLGMKLEDVMKVTVQMMDYLIDREEELSITTMVEGKEQDFFNEQDRLHMADVKVLFLGGLKLRNWAAVVALALVAVLILRKADLGSVLFKGFIRAFVAVLIAAGIIGILFATDFTKYFTIFHEIFFTNDLWMFDPAEDYMIRMLPEGFFADMLLRIGVTFGALMAVTLVIIGFLRRFYKNIRTSNKSD